MFQECLFSMIIVGHSLLFDGSYRRIAAPELGRANLKVYPSSRNTFATK